MHESNQKPFYISMFQTLTCEWEEHNTHHSRGTHVLENLRILNNDLLRSSWEETHKQFTIRYLLDLISFLRTHACSDQASPCCAEGRRTCCGWVCDCVCCACWACCCWACRAFCSSVGKPSTALDCISLFSHSCSVTEGQRDAGLNNPSIHAAC